MALLKADASLTDRRFSAWRWTMWLALAAALVKAAYLITLSPFELAADECHYWEWSRRLDLAYYTKGPGVAWVIWMSTRLFGSSEWAIRLPAVASSLITTLAVARLAIESSLGVAGESTGQLVRRRSRSGWSQAQRAGLFAAGLFLLLPGFLVASLLMTIDSPYVACWALAAWMGWRVTVGLRDGRARWGAWLLLGLTLGVGFLFKYTILLLAPGLLLAWVWSRRELKWSLSQVAGGALAVLVFAAAISPVIIWNQQRNWPTLAHLLGHLHMAGGDVAARKSFEYNPLWTLGYFGAQLGLLGPVAILFAAAVWRVLQRSRGGTKLVSTGRALVGPRFLVAAAAPVLLFYLAVSFRTDVEGNWPIAGYVTLCALAGQFAAREWRRYRSLLSAWRATPAPRPKRGLIRRQPETLWQVCMHWQAGYAVAAIVGVVFMPQLSALPGAAAMSPWSRLTGHRAEAREVAGLIDEAFAHSGQEPIVIGSAYHNASLLAYYLPGNPLVYCAGHLRGGRETAYDFFADVRLDDDRLLGRPVVLVGGSPSSWTDCLKLDTIVRPIERQRYYVGYGFAGPKKSHDHQADSRQAAVSQ